MTDRSIYADEGKATKPIFYSLPDLPLGKLLIFLVATLFEQIL